MNTTTSELSVSSENYYTVIVLQSIWDILMLLHTLQKIYIFLIFMKKLCLWLFSFNRYAKQSKAKKIYTTSAEK